MQRRWIGALVLLIACGPQIHAHEAPAPAPDPSATDVAVAAHPAAEVASGPSTAVASDTTRHGIRRDTALDSASDAAVLDSLATDQPSAALPDLPIATHATWDLNVADFSGQPRVQYYLDYFTGRAHDRFQIWLDRMAAYEDYARHDFVAHHLPGDFVYLALIESGFSPDAVSRASAVGIWQFMLGTGKLYGLRIDSWVDERRDPIKSTDAAVRALADLSARFGSHYLAAAAYNAGAGRVARGLDQINDPDDPSDDSINVADDSAFFTLADTRLIRDETKNYVPQLIAAALIAKEPYKYGFSADSDAAPFSRDSVMVDGGTGIDLIARLADTTVDALRRLNPDLLRMVTPPGGTYPVRVPIGTAERVADAYDALPEGQRRALAVHQVRAGESVVTVARKYHVSADLIRTTNRNARGRHLSPGATLYIPVNTTIPAAYLREPDPPRETRTVTRTVIVRRGESIASVARRAGESVTRLRADNHLARTATLRAGQHLLARRTVVIVHGRTLAFAATSHKRASHAASTRTAPRRPVSKRAVAMQASTAVHVVRAGETLSGIARRYGVRQETLIALNGLDATGRIEAGQSLRIPDGV